MKHGTMMLGRALRSGPGSWVLMAVLASCAPLSGQEPPGRVGVAGPGHALGLREAILMALQHNPEVRIERANLEIERFSLLGKEGAYDLVLGGDLSFVSETLPVGSVLAGGGRASVASDSLKGVLSLRHNLPFGGSYTAELDNRRSTTTNVFTQLDPQFPSSWNVTLVLPLWRDFGSNQSRRDVRVAAKSIERSAAEFRRILLDVVTGVREAYWELVFSREDGEVRREAVQLAREQVGRNQRLLEAGQAAAVDVIEAEAELQRRQEELLASEERITNRENDLKRQVLGSRTADLWGRELVPADRAEEGRSSVELTEAWHVALEMRPELESLRHELESQQIETRHFRNQTAPKIDLVAAYGSNGLAGTLRAGDNPFTSQNVALLARVNELSRLQGLTPLPDSSPNALPSSLIGGLGQSLDNLLGNDFRTGEIGVRVEIPIGNRSARGDLGRSLALERRIEGRRAQVEQRIESEIRDAMQAVQTARKRVQASGAARRASFEKLESERRLFQSGETTNFLVLTREKDYTDNRAREVRARMDLNIAVARLQRTLGDALDTFDIRVDTLR